jgi:large subunit ribosomal protein L2
VGFYYDPYRTARLAKIIHLEKDLNTTKKQYSLIPVSKGITLFQNVNVYNYDFSSVRSLESVVLHPGDRTALKNLEPGDVVNSVSFEKNSNPIFARSAGVSCQVISIDNKYVTLRRPSGQLRRFSPFARASIGSIENDDKSTLARGRGVSKGADNLGLRKAGRSR